MKYIIPILLFCSLISQNAVGQELCDQIKETSINHEWDIKNFIDCTVIMLVDKPDEVQVNAVETEQRIIYELTVNEGDYDKVIGKRGRNISALRTLVFAMNAKEGGKRVRLDIINN